MIGDCTDETCIPIDELAKGDLISFDGEAKKRYIGFFRWS